MEETKQKSGFGFINLAMSVVLEVKGFFQSLPDIGKQFESSDDPDNGKQNLENGILLLKIQVLF